MNVKKLSLLAVFSVLLSACATTDKVDISTVNSGFLSNYNNLTKAKVDDDSMVIRDVSDDFKQRKITSVILTPVKFHPEPKENPNVSNAMLDSVLAYSNTKFSEAISSTTSLDTQVTPGAIRLDIAITELNIVDKKLSAFQYIPVAFLITAASGKLNDMIVKLTIEAEVFDAESGKSLGRVIKTGFGEVLDNSESQLTMEDIKPLIDKWSETIKNVTLKKQ